MAKIYVTGPALLWIQVQLNGSGPRFFGTSEFSPYIDIRPYFAPVFSDTTGKVIPCDKVYMGQEAFIFFHLTRWNEAVYTQMAARPSPQFLAPGLDFYGDIGTAMNAEKSSVVVWVVFPYQKFFPDMPAGYHFLNAWLEGPDRLDPLGTDARGLDVLFYASQKLGGDAGLTCYDNDVSAVAGMAID